VVHADPRSAEEMKAEHLRRDSGNAILDRAAALRSNSRRTHDAYLKMLAGDHVLSTSERATVGQLTVAVDAEVKRAADSHKGAQANEAALVNEIAAHFDDDAPRLVYADLLSERGDVRGPYITMAVQQARGEGKLKGKLDAYEKKHRNELLGPLKPVVESYGLKFARGFVDEVTLQDRGVPWSDKTIIDAIASDLRWATLRSLTVKSYYNQKVSAILAEAPLFSLRLLKDVSLSALGKLLARDETFPIERIEGLLLDTDDREKPLPMSGELARLLAVAHQKLPALRELNFFNFDLPPEELLRAPLLQRLESISGGSESFGGRVPVAAWMQRLSAVHWPVPTLTILASWVKFTVETSGGALSRLSLDLSSTWFGSGWKDEWPGYVAELKAIPAGLFPSVEVKLGAQKPEERKAALAALAHLHPSLI
jgi:uncharacterized protein (TIGR02996 family)